MTGRRVRPVLELMPGELSEQVDGLDIMHNMHYYNAI